MSVTYHTLLRQIAHRAGMLRGEETFGVETSYIATPLTVVELLDTGLYPLQAMKDALLQAEETTANVIAGTGGHPWRAALKAVTASLAHKASLPILDSANKPIIGIYGSVYDASDGKVCTERPLEIISRRVDNTGAFFKAGVYWYKLDGTRIYHTRTNVLIDVCSYDRSVQSTAVNANSAMLLPDTLDTALVCGALGLLKVPGLGEGYYSYFGDQLAMISKGLTSVASKLTPGPTLAPRAT